MLQLEGFNVDLYAKSSLVTGWLNLNGTEDDGLYVYLNAWTRSNYTLTTKYMLQHRNKSRISIWYGYNRGSTQMCLSTKGMSWQDLQRWTVVNCTIGDHLLVLEFKDPTRRDKSRLETL